MSLDRLWSLPERRGDSVAKDVAPRRRYGENGSATTKTLMILALAGGFALAIAWALWPKQDVRYSEAVRRCLNSTVGMSEELAAKRMEACALMQENEMRLQRAKEFMSGKGK